MGKSAILSNEYVDDDFGASVESDKVSEKKKESVRSSKQKLPDLRFSDEAVKPKELVVNKSLDL